MVQGRGEACARLAPTHFGFLGPPEKQLWEGGGPNAKQAHVPRPKARVTGSSAKSIFTLKAGVRISWGKAQTLGIFFSLDAL